MKPERRIEGQEEKERELHGLQLVLSKSGECDANGQVGRDKEERDGVEQRQTAEHRHVEEEVRRYQDEGHLDVADGDVGQDFPHHDLEGTHRRGEQGLHRAALALAGDGERGDDYHGHGENHAHQAGHDVELGDVLGVVVGVDAEIDRAVFGVEAGERAGEVAVKNGVGEFADG